MRSGPAATSGVDAVETKACPRTPGGVSATVVLREHLDILMALAAVDLVLDAEVGEVDAIIEVRQFVVLRPSADLFLVAVRPPVTISPVAVVMWLRKSNCAGRLSAASNWSSTSWRVNRGPVGKSMVRTRAPVRWAARSHA